MYQKNDKRRLYWLIELYLEYKIDDSTFCDEFYYSYDLEIDGSTLTDIEKCSFSKLGEVTSRFSEFEEDQALDPNAFSTKEEVRQAVMETKKKLKDTFLILCS